MPLSKWDIDHFEDIMRGEGDWFTAQLLRLIVKADDSNRERIRIAFPAEVALYEAWYYKNDEHPYPVPVW